MEIGEVLAHLVLATCHNPNSRMPVVSMITPPGNRYSFDPVVVCRPFSFPSLTASQYPRPEQARSAMTSTRVLCGSGRESALFRGGNDDYSLGLSGCHSSILLPSGS